MTGMIFARAGIKKTDKVVLYSDGDGVLGAAMIAYLLERVGHTNILFVDGGWRDYKAAQKTVQEYPAYKPAGYDVLDNRGVRATLDDVKNAIGTGGVKFIDARPADVYRGEVKIWTRNGHIPGAVNVPWKLLVEENNPHKFKSADEMRKIYAERGIREADDIIVYCGTSREASLEYLVLKHILKFPKVRLYEGSWAEYSNHPQMQVETGAGK
jgi:thiosulfate/3-mercaptopyruvate sulfurtransferase